MYKHLFGTIAPLFTLICLSANMAAAEIGPGHEPLRYIGYFHDGTGVFRDCTPVTTWNEYDYKMVSTGKDTKGKDITTLVVDKENHQNIVWKVPHYNWCNGSMTMAGGKLFGMSDRGGLGFYADRPADFFGAELFCIDPADGKTLWKVDIDHWDLLPEDAPLRGDAARELLRTYNKKIVEIYSKWWPMGSAIRDNHGLKNFDEERFARLTGPLREILPELPKTVAEAKGHLIDDGGYEQGVFGKAMK